MLKSFMVIIGLLNTLDIDRHNKIDDTKRKTVFSQNLFSRQQSKYLEVLKFKRWMFPRDNNTFLYQFSSYAGYLTANNHSLNID